MADELAIEVDNAHRNRPWRRFPSGALAPEVRAFVARLSRDVVERALLAPRKELCRRLLEELRERESRTGLTSRGYRKGVWPPARVAQETVLLRATHKLIAACVAVMVVEADDVTEGLLADALRRMVEGASPSASLLAVDLRNSLATIPSSTSAVLADIAWAFRSYGAPGALTSPKFSSPEAQMLNAHAKSIDLAVELEESRTALLGAMSRMRAVVVELDAARDVRRAEAEDALEAAIQSAQRVRGALAAAALLVPDAVDAATSSEHLAIVVQRANEALRALAAPKGRQHLERLSAELARGRIVASNPMRRTTLERHRAAAADEAKSGLLVARQGVESFPGPPDESDWLAWYWSTTNPEETSQIAGALDGTWNQIFEFLGIVQQQDWSPADEVEAVGPNTAAAADSSPANERSEDKDARLTQALASHGDESDGVAGEVPVAATSVSVDVGAGRHDSSVQPHAVASLDKPNSPTLAVLGSVGEPRAIDSSGSAKATQRSAAMGRSKLAVPSFEQFRRTHWVDRTGQVTQAPWSTEGASADFASRARASFMQCMLADDWAQARLLLIALHRLVDVNVPRIEDYNRASTLRAGRGALLSQIEHVEMANDLRTLLDSGPDGERDRFRIAVGLAVPAVVKLMSHEHLEHLIELAGFSERFRAFLLAWTGGARVLPDPFAALARQLRLGQPPSPDELRKKEDTARAELRSRARDLHSAAGNRVQRTHCRAGWDEFMTEARPWIDQVLVSPSEPTLRTEAARLRKKATKIFDRFEAKFGDRTLMDRAVDSLIDAATTLFRAADAAAAASNPTNPVEGFPPAVTQLALAQHVDLQQEEKLLLRFFTTTLRRQATAPSDVLPAAVVEAHPWVLSTWPLGSDPSRSADVSQCEEPLAAAAHLLAPEAPKEAGTSLRSWVFNNAPWLLAHLLSLNERERAVVEDLQRRDRNTLDDVQARLRKRHVDLAEIADQDATIVADIIRNIDNQGRTTSRDGGLLTAWAVFILARVEEHFEATLRGVADEAERAGLTRADVDSLVARRRYADLHVRSTKSAGPDVPHVRATPFRVEGDQRWSEPRSALASLASDPGAENNEPLRTLLREWCHHSKHASTALGIDKQKVLRDAFVEVVFEQTIQRRKTRINVTKGAHRVSCAVVAEWLAASARPPTFLPQLHRYSEFVVKVLPVAAADRALPAKLLSVGEDGVITVVLAPGLSEQQREDARSQFRQASGKPIALIDDFDLCRLLNPGGQQPALIEGLVELAIEQQRWEEFGPYEVQEGQHVRMEMYVGRRVEAERLVTGTTYSRIFSGRRLGKTALLRYVEHRYDNTPLASGNTLRVLYVSIVGAGSETEVVTEIVEKLEASSGIKAPKKATPRDRLKAAIESTLSAKPTESFLIFLDEADTFFETQARLGELAGAEESSLSWTMRNSEHLKDANQHPRIRFVVCGYRATNRSEGAWGNWGDVLLLNPLEPADAVLLVSGPLARLGIDARDQADAIAFRCGYQPAVIIYFCARLLDELGRKTAFTERERRVVTSDDVVAVFQLPEVQDRVRETCWLNFVGDPLGQLTFAAFLAESAGLAPGTPVEDAPQRILAHVLRESDGKANQELGVGTWQDVGSRHLRDLVKRSLLSEAEHHPLSLRLRFPHQLPILLQESPQVRIRDALNRLGTSHKEKKRTEWLVPEDVLENMRWCLGLDAWELGMRNAVFASHWSAPLLTGLQTRLPEGRLVNHLATPKDLDVSQANARALVGGADLLRAALRRGTEEATAVEVARLGRLTSDAVESYFKRAQGVEFASPGALMQIMKLTCGVPLILQKISALFPKGATVTASQLDEALATTTAALPTLSKGLVAGPPDIQLDRRELELLQLLILASTHAPDAVDVFISDRELVAAAVNERGLGSVKPLGPGDNERLALLLTLGLIPRKPLATASGWALSDVAAVAEGDVLYALVASAHGMSATS